MKQIVKELLEERKILVNDLKRLDKLINTCIMEELEEIMKDE